MFAEAIENVGGFTRPVQFITRTYRKDVTLPCTGTFFFVNDDGVGITCKHVAEDIIRRQNVAKDYAAFIEARDQIPNTKNKKAAVRKLEEKNGFHENVATHALTRFVDCFDSFKEITFHLHEKYDLAIIHFKGIEGKRYTGHATFCASDDFVKPGDYLCRLGFPFAEFDDYEYIAETDTLRWKPNVPTRTPRFPLDGMVTRFIGDDTGRVFGIELSTPGLRGQSGGPLFDEDGIIAGMQFATNHLHLGFDIDNVELNVGGQRKVINNQPFLHVGQCINARIIKEFLDQHDIAYFTE